MSKKSCIVRPTVGNEVSKLYTDLENKITDKNIVSYIYSVYKALPDIGNAMDKAGLKRNTQGEHRAIDVMRFLKTDTILTERSKLLNEEAREYGFVDDSYNVITFDSVKEAYEKAIDFNSKHQWRLATVAEYNGKYGVILQEKSSDNAVEGFSIIRDKKLYDKVETILKQLGVSFDELSFLGLKETSPYGMQDFINYVKFAKNMSPETMGGKELSLLLTLGKNNTKVQNLLLRYPGTLQETTDKIWSDLHDDTVSGVVKSQILSTLKEAANSFNLQEFFDAAKTTKEELQDTDEAKVSKTLTELNKSFSSNTTILIRNAGKITSLADAAQAALHTMQRQMDRLQKKNAPKETIEAYDRKIDALAKAIEEKEYVSGLLGFLKQATDHAEAINKAIPNLSDIVDRDSALKASSQIRQLMNYRDAYEDLIEVLASDNPIPSEIQVTTTDRMQLQMMAKQIKSSLDVQLDNLRKLQKLIAYRIYVDILGTSPLPIMTTNGMNFETIADLLEMHYQDASLFDRLYSMERISHPFLAGIGGLIRNAQQKRDNIMLDYDTRIKRITHKLYSAKGQRQNTNFMYEPIKNPKTNKTVGYRIISDIDWNAYNKEKQNAIKAIARQGLRGYAFKAALQDWENANSVNRVVDSKSGRTERIPSEKYRLIGANNPLLSLTPAQREYYEEMMQIKGELGTMLPEYAQMQYIPPKIRKHGVIENVESLLNKDISFNEWVKGVVDNLNIIKNLKGRSDDTELKQQRGSEILLDNEAVTTNIGTFAGTPAYDIPIYFIGGNESPTTQLMDFSGSLESFAATAINYTTMDEIVDAVEVIKDYFDGGVSESSVPTQAKTKNKKPLVSTIERGNLKSVEVLREKMAAGGKFNELFDAITRMQIYGEKQVDPTVIYNLARAVLSYTSFVGLAPNVKGAAANWIIGVAQTWMEAGAKEYYGYKDFFFAQTYLYGTKLCTAGEAVIGRGALADLFTQGKTSLLSLLVDKFDPIQETFREKQHTRYRSTFFGKLASGWDPMFLYKWGETIIHYEGMIALLHYEKARLNGKIVPLLSCFEKSNKIDGTCELKIKDGATRLNFEPITEEYLQSVKDNIRTVNQKCYGAMNYESKGELSRYIWFKHIIQFFQWAVEHMSRRYRGGHIDPGAGNVLDRNMYSKEVLDNGKKISLLQAFDIEKHADGSMDWILRDGITKLDGTELTQETLKDWVNFENNQKKFQRGYWTDSYLLIRDLMRALKDHEFAEKYNNIPTRQIYNLRRAFNELCTLGEASALISLVLIPLMSDDDRNEDWGWRMALYTLKRTQQDLYQFTPIGMPQMVLQRLKNPIPAAKTFENFILLILGLFNGDLVTPANKNEAIKDEDTGKWVPKEDDEGNEIPYDTKYVRRLKKTFGWWQIEQILRFAHDDKQFLGVGGFPKDEIDAKNEENDYLYGKVR